MEEEEEADEMETEDDDADMGTLPLANWLADILDRVCLFESVRRL